MSVKRKIIFIVIFISTILLLNIKSYATSIQDLKNKYPEGRYWNHYANYSNGHNGNMCQTQGCNNPDGTTTSPCRSHNSVVADGCPDCNSFDGAIQCKGFAYKVFYDFYAHHYYEYGQHRDLSKLKSGDILVYKNEKTDQTFGHTVWVTGVDSNYIYIGECNVSGVNCLISWSRAMPKWEIKEILYIVSAPYEASGDSSPPTIEQAYIDERSLDGYSYKVVVNASDESGIDRVEVRTFTTQKFGSNGRSDDDLVVNNAVYNTYTGNYESMVYKSEHNFEDGLYLTEIYVWDKKGNYAHKVFEPISINSVRTDLGEFEGRITLKYDRNYVIGIEPKSWNVNNVVLRKKDLNDDSQVWNFKKGDSGDYKITNKSTGLVMDVERMEDVNGTNVQAYTSNEKVNQRFYIFKYNDGYRLSARCSADLKGVDVPNLKLEDGHNITIGKTNSPTNNAQTFLFEPVGYEVLYPKGDINGDNKVTLIDYGMVLAHVKRTKLLEGEQLKRADVNEDGKVTLIDYGLILAYVKRTKLLF